MTIKCANFFIIPPIEIMTIGHLPDYYTIVLYKVNRQMTFRHFLLKVLYKVKLIPKIIYMAGLIAQKKEEKRKKILDAAYELFKSSSVSDTSISMICEKAGIAKGTFYLYFQDKEDVLRNLVRRISFDILKDAHNNIKQSDSFVDSVISMANYLIELFKYDKDALLVIKKDFIWPISEEEFNTTNDPTMSKIREAINKYSKEIGMSEHKILLRLYSLISMLCSVCYSSIIDGFPNDIDNLKNEIFEITKRTLTNE